LYVIPGIAEEVLLKFPALNLLWCRLECNEEAKFS
jgi:hypothetical protein